MNADEIQEARWRELDQELILALFEGKNARHSAIKIQRVWDGYNPNSPEVMQAIRRAVYAVGLRSMNIIVGNAPASVIRKMQQAYLDGGNSHD